ncbi:PqiC family protein [Caldimonas thermodepolymerans]|uniref:PqiC family protein n=1 Tax=Caldimonas thermodepolymerans TaxID=215580 RepID=UPI002236AE18|nr:PqiC family protein [Caldimonas thermodepolymerans]UZG44730.1 PqiC family protein [Caldimonas thermodepolymerans]
MTHASATPLPAPRRRPLRLAACAALLALLGACAGPRPAATLLTLPPTPPAAAMPTMAPGPVVVVRRIALPEYLQSRRVRYRSGSSTLEEWPHVAWAERIDVGASRHLVAGLRAALPGWVVCESDCPSGPDERLLKVELASFDYDRAARTVHGEARISIAAPAAPQRLLRTAVHREALAVGADTPEGQAQAMAQLLQQVARAAAAELEASRGTPR